MNIKKPTLAAQLGKALCYYLLFLGSQALVSICFSVIEALFIIMNNPDLDSSAYTEMMSQKISQHMAYMVFAYTLLSLLFVVAFFWIRKKNPLWEVGITKFAPRHILPLLAFSVGLTAFVNTAMMLLPEDWLNSYSQSAQILSEGEFLPMLIATGICAPILEEVIFRGLILSRLKTVCPLWVAVLISSLAFGLAHGHPLWVAYATALGVLFCFLTLKTGSILPSMLAHAVFNSLGTCLNFSDLNISLLVYMYLLVGGALFTVGGILYFARLSRPD